MCVIMQMYLFSMIMGQTYCTTWPNIDSIKCKLGILRILVVKCAHFRYTSLTQ